MLAICMALLMASLATLHSADQPQTSTKPDRVLADFEQGYGDWKAKGEAFNHPATDIRGGVKGFAGKGLADSWDPDRWSLAGTLTSPEFTIDRNFIRFLIGARSGSGRTGLQLLIDGKPEFYAGGAADRELRPGVFDVSSFQGRKAQFVINDAGVWEYVIVDDIVASDSPGEGVNVLHPISQCVPVDKEMDLEEMRYLVLPINNLAPQVDCILAVDGRPKKNLQMRLAIDVPVDFWASYPLDDLDGKKLRFHSGKPAVFKDQAEGFMKQISLSPQPRDQEGVYAEPGRPQLSFTVKRGHSMDPNGLCFYKGLYHLLYQYNAVALMASNQQWGHATSPDLFHWTEQPVAIPNGLGWRAFSGSGVVDKNNDSGLKQGADAPILLFLAQEGRSATALAYSVDGGKTFLQYAKNPLFLNQDPSGHDPKVVWYPNEQKWVMIIHDKRNDVYGFDFYESRNLLDWKYLSTSPGWFETPDLFSLPLDGDTNKMKWIVQECSHTYKIGDFNGREFVPETEKLSTFQGDFGAAQVFDNVPDGRRIMMGCLFGARYFKDDPSLPVGGGMNIPVEVTLRSSPTGPRLYLYPVKEIDTLVSARHDFKNITLDELAAKLTDIKPDLFDLEFEWDAAQQKDFRLSVWDREVFAFHAKDSTFSVDGEVHKIAPAKGTIKVRMICDRSLCSFYINDGYEAGNRNLGKFRPECKEALKLQGLPGQMFKTFQVRSLRPAWRARASSGSNSPTGSMKSHV